MIVQELQTYLATFSEDAEVVFWLMGCDRLNEPIWCRRISLNRIETGKAGEVSDE